MTHHEACEAVIGRLRGASVEIVLVVDDGDGGLECWIDPAPGQLPGCLAFTGTLPRWHEQPDRAATPGRVGASSHANPHGRKTTGQCGKQRRRYRLSIRLMSQVWEDARIQSQPELLVLLALADHARDDGVCWPSIRTIAAKARVEERSAQRILRRLIEKGLVELVTKGGCIEGHNVPNRYRVTGGDTASPHGPTEGHPGATSGQGVGGDRQSPRGDPENPDGVTLGQGNHHIEPSLSKTTTTTYTNNRIIKRAMAMKQQKASSSRRFFVGEGSSESREQAKSRFGNRKCFGFDRSVGPRIWTESKAAESRERVSATHEARNTSGERPKSSARSRDRTLQGH